MNAVRRHPWLVLVPMVFAFALVGLIEAWRDAPTVDESIDIAAGVTSLVRHDLRLMPEHGVLTKLVPALPALAGHPIIPDGPGYRSGDWFAHTDEFVRANAAAGRLHRVVFLSRLVPLLEADAVGGLIYVLAARLFGEWSGVFAAGLWLTTPVFVGIGHLVSIDVAFTLATLAVCLALLRYLELRTDGRAVLLSGALVAALLTRHLGLVLVAVAVVVVVATGDADRTVRLRHAGITAFTCWVGVWVVVRLLAFSAPGGAAGARWDGMISAARGDSLIARLVLAVPWPREWAAGFAYLTLTSTARPAYLLGHAWTGGRWWYFLAVTVVKVPLPALLATIAGLLAWTRVADADRRRALLVVIVPAGALYLAIASQPLNLGLRYAFPCLALLFVGAGPVAATANAAVRKAGGSALVLTQAAALLVAFPHSLAWTPPPFQPGYRFASDSNIDWAQDKGRVDDWSVGRTPLVDLLLPVGVDPPPGSRSLLDVPLAEVHGWVAVSATRLTVIDRDALSWLRAYCPVDTIGGSVLLYRFDAPVDASPGPTEPPGLCAGDVSTRVG